MSSPPRHLRQRAQYRGASPTGLLKAHCAANARRYAGRVHRGREPADPVFCPQFPVDERLPDQDGAPAAGGPRAGALWSEVHGAIARPGIASRPMILAHLGPKGPMLNTLRRRRALAVAITAAAASASIAYGAGSGPLNANAQGGNPAASSDGGGGGADIHLFAPSSGDRAGLDSKGFFVDLKAGLNL